MNRYIFIQNNSLSNNVYDMLSIEYDNPFVNSYFSSYDDFIKFCKNYYRYMMCKPKIEIYKENSIVVVLEDIKIIFENEMDIEFFIKKYNTLLKKSELKTPFFILINDFNISAFIDGATENKFCSLKNTLCIKDNILNTINEYFRNRSPEKNIIYHVYALCYNESRLLPHFLNHYKDADKIIILDNESTDNSIQLMFDNNVDEIMSFKSNNGFNDTIHKDLKNQIWKKSRDIADFVIVQDMDEFVVFPNNPYNIKKGFQDLKKLDSSYVICQGYDMCCSDHEFDNIPNNKPIFDYINKGSYNVSYCKPNIINPNKLTETNWSVGNHNINPIPSVKNTEYNILILHFKHLGIKWEFNRRRILRDKLTLCYHGCGTEYICNDDETLKYILDFHGKAKDLTKIINLNI